MKTRRTKKLFALLLCSATVPSILFSAEEAEKSVKLTPKPLFDAIKKNDPGGVMAAIESGVNVNTTKNLSYPTPLSYAAQYNRPKIAVLLIEHRADVNQKCYPEPSALTCAILRGNKEMIELLIKRKSDIDCTDQNGNTLLSTAAQDGRLTIATQLIKARANVNHCNKNDWSVLMLAKNFFRTDRSKKMIELLISSGATQPVEEELLDVIQDGNMNKIKEIFETINVDLDYSNTSGTTPISLARRSNNRTDLLKLMINYRDKNGYTTD